MRFHMPNYPCEFEIPDVWLAEAEISRFVPRSGAYYSVAGAAIVPIGEIEPPYRNLAVPKDWHGFVRSRMVSALRGMAAGVEIPPVQMLQLPSEISGHRSPYRYRILDGYHRFFAAIAIGFDHLPASFARSAA